RPNHARLAGLLALAGFAGSLIASGFVALHYPAYKAEAAQYVRLSEIPASMRAGAQKSAELVARYPKDPIAHLLRAVYFVDEHRLGEAENALRTTIALAATDVAGGAIRVQAQAILAALLADQGRLTEAKALAADSCHGGSSDTMKRILVKAKLC